MLRRARIRRRYRKLSRRELDLIPALVEIYSINQIANWIGCSGSTVYKVATGRMHSSGHRWQHA